MAFGDVAAAWGILEDLGSLLGVIDEVTGSCLAGAALSAGTYLALAALNRLVAPCSKAAFADWWITTAGDWLAKIPAPALDHRYFWDAMHAVTLEQLEEISRTIAVRIVGLSGGWTMSSAAPTPPTSPRSSRPRTARRQSRSGARPSRNAPTCGWSGWGWWSPGTAGSR